MSESNKSESGSSTKSAETQNTKEAERIKAASKSTGLIPLPAETFAHDVAIGDRYQNFSAELLRLSLAGIGAVGFLITNIVLADKKKDFPNKPVNLLSLNLHFDYLIFTSLIFFGISAGLALLHRYFSTDGKAYHLSYIRQEQKLSLNECNLKEKKPAADGKRGLWACFKLYLHLPKEDNPEKRAENVKGARNFLLKFSGWLLFFSGLFLWLAAMSLILSFMAIIFNQ
jgi:hypothetical protein